MRYLLVILTASCGTLSKKPQTNRELTERVVRLEERVRYLESAVRSLRDGIEEFDLEEREEIIR
jgi:hypothetical protein